MRLSRAATFFDHLVARDAYSGNYAFNCQLGLYDESRRDAVGAQRRVISMAPHLVASVPVRRTVELQDVGRFILGELVNTDTYAGGPLRASLVAHAAPEAIHYGTPGQVISQTGATLYAGLAWAKDWKEGEISSRVHAYYDVFVARREPLGEGVYFLLDDEHYRVRSSYVSEMGFRVLESDALGMALKAIVIHQSGTYDPIADTHTAAPASGNGLFFHYQANFRYFQQITDDYERGDAVAIVPKSTFAAVSRSSKVEVGGALYSILAVSSESDCWHLHLRP